MTYSLARAMTDGSSDLNSYDTLERATWNFTEAILKDFVVEAKITTDHGRKIIAKWHRNGYEIDAEETVRVINLLRADEGDGLTINSPNADFNGLPNEAIDCCGGWTKPAYIDERFTGDTLLDALRNAFAAKSMREQVAGK